MTDFSQPPRRAPPPPARPPLPSFSAVAVTDDPPPYTNALPRHAAVGLVGAVSFGDSQYDQDEVDNDTYDDDLDDYESDDDEDEDERVEPVDFSAPRPAPLPDMGEQRPTWRRGQSMRGSSRSTAQQQQRKPMPEVEQDGYVPYRPPFVSASAYSLSPPVAPSGAQGIGQAPASVPKPTPPPEKRRSFFGGWWFGGRRKNKQSKLVSVSTPTLLHPAASTLSFGHTPHHPQRGRHYQHQHHHNHSTHQLYDGDPFGYPGPSGSHFGQTLVGPYGHYAHQTYGHSSSAHHVPYGMGHSTVQPSPSVTTGLSAPKMLFSPLSRTLRNIGSGSSLPFGSTPNLPAQPTHQQHSDHHPMPSAQFTAETSRPYPRVGANGSWATLPSKSSAAWAAASRPQYSSISLHSEGSKSRLAVTTMCDALTFPRPRMNAHDVTPPDSPNAPPSDEGDAPFKDAIAQGGRRDAEREEWAGIARRSRSGSLRRLSGDTTSAPPTPARLGGRPSIVTRYNTVSEKPTHRRSNSTSSSIHNIFSRHGRNGHGVRSHDDLQYTREKEKGNFDRTNLPERKDSLSMQSDTRSHPTRSDSQRTATSSSKTPRSNSYRSLFGSATRPRSQSHTPLPKSGFSNNSASEDSRAMRRAQSVRYHSSVSNPDLLHVPGSPSRHHRNGPPRTLQFRPSNHARNGSSSTGVVVVGATSSRTRAPRAVDFAEPTRRAPSPTPPPQISTPERGSPFTFNSDEIGVALTTVGNEAASPPPQTVQHRLPMATPPRGYPKEPPSSAHARYLLASQHRRSVTMRAFQSPPMSPTRKSDRSPMIYPQAGSSISSLSALSPTFQTTFERPEYPTPRRQAAASATVLEPSPMPDSKTVPVPPLPKTSFFARALSATSSPTHKSQPSKRKSPPPKANVSRTSTLGPRAKPGTPIRPRSSSLSTHRSLNSSTSSFEVPVPIIAPLPQVTPTSRMPVQEDKALPSLPGMPQSLPARIPPPRAPPSRPVPPTPPYPPQNLSRSGSSSTLNEVPTPTGLHHRQSASVSVTGTQPQVTPQTHQRQAASLSAVSAMTPLATLVSRPLGNVDAETPNSADWSDGSPTMGRGNAGTKATGATAPMPPGAPAPSRLMTPPPPNLPTIMDESPTPVRQMAVSVLAPPSVSPTSPIPAPNTTPAAFLARAMGSVQQRGESTRPGIPAQLFTSDSSESLPPAELGGSVRSVRSHRNNPSVSTVSATPDSFWPLRGGGDSSDDEGVRDRTTSVIADTSGVLGRATPDSVRFVSAPLVEHMVFPVGERMTSPVSQRIASPVAHSFRTARSLRSQRSLGDMRRPESEASQYSTATTADVWATPNATPMTSQISLNDSDHEVEQMEEVDDDSASETTLPDLFLASGSSQQSHYTDAQDGGWESPVSASPFEFDVPTPSVSTHHNQSDVSPSAVAAAVAAQGDAIEILPNATPRARSRGQLDAETENGLRAATGHSLFERRHSHNSAMSSGSEGSVRPSMDESFRGLFYRTPHITSPNNDRSPAQQEQSQAQRHRRAAPAQLLFQRSANAPSEPIGLGYDLEGSNSGDATRSDGTLEIRTPVISSERVPLPMARSSADSLQQSPAPTQGLGMGGMLAPAFDNRIEIASGTDGPSPRQDSWIADSYQRAILRSATPAGLLRGSQRKPRPLSSGDQFSPTTFGVSTERFESLSTGQTTPKTPKQVDSSGISSAGALTPNPDVIVRFPTPPTHRV